MKKPTPKLAVLVAALLAAALVQADVNVGVTLSVTGPAASLGIPERNTIALLPPVVAGQKINYLVLDDGSDPPTALANARKLVGEHKVDVLLGSTTSPNSLAMIEVAAESRTPMISLAASARIVEPMDARRRWVFKTPQNDSAMSQAIAEHMAAQGVRNVGFIGFADAYGEGWFQEFSRAAALRNIKVVANERYARTDASVTTQAFRILAVKPEAVLVAAAGTPAVLPQKTLRERGYTGRFYQTHGVANADFLRVGGKEVEGTYLPAGPVLVAEQLPATHPVRKSALTYITLWEGLYGKGTLSAFGAHAWDAGLLLTTALPAALKKAQPGSAEFRAALRDALEAVHEMPGAHGIFTMSPTDHLGLDQRARVMVRIENGAWRLQAGAGP
ncbi:ABC transporter substrate-binding protein [uncultured Azohydromonas sp.]|jgi:ABC-type branched-chain amino acid transport systems, periplasmic component|uniref:ABC transporter substrate-binding protein n=1 Tax=uncultured Azohydromonas sp. TaxID=487342 RepID=UPI0026373E09|nr:ABC transporter substrate-binding protein [uncultured Azohydromonas sp.]